MDKVLTVKEIKGLIETMGAKLAELYGDVQMMTSTHSVAQDALRAGFQTTCAKGIAKLFKVDDVTVEQCKNFLPRHTDNVQVKIAELQKEWAKYCEEFPEKRRKKLLDELTKWQFIKRMKIKKMVLPQPVVVGYTWGDPETSIANGVISTKILVEVSYPDIYKDTPDEKNYVKDYYVNTTAKRGVVNYESYHTYSKSWIPDDVVDVVKEAIAIGLKNIQVAYPAINDGKVPDRDPIVVGYIPHEIIVGSGNDARKTTVEDMYILAWFGYDSKNPMVCNI